MNIAALLLSTVLLTGEPIGNDSTTPLNREDSRQLQFQDMLTLLLLPRMNEKLAEVYAKYLNTAPQLYPYFVDVKRVERLNGFRGYEFLLELDAYPTIGPHIGVGEDTFTFRISPMAKIELVRFEHKRGPDKKHIPPNDLDLIK